MSKQQPHSHDRETKCINKYCAIYNLHLQALMNVSVMEYSVLQLTLFSYKTLQPRATARSPHSSLLLDRRGSYKLAVVCDDGFLLNDVNTRAFVTSISK